MADMMSILQAHYKAAGLSVPSKTPYVAVDPALYEGSWTGKYPDSKTFTINVSNVEDEPTANDDTVTVDEDAPTDVTSQLLANDTDPDDDTLTVTSVSNETGGDADLTGTTVTFTAPADECGPGLGSFDYTISDGNGGTDSAHAVVDVTCVNDDPVGAWQRGDREVVHALARLEMRSVGLRPPPVRGA